MKRRLLVQRQRLPDGVAVRPQSVHRRAPADRGASLAQPAEQLSRIAQWHFVQLDRRRLMIRMRVRDEPAPRQSNDPSAMPGGVERQDRVDHGQAGADDQDVGVGCGSIGDRVVRLRRSTDCR